MSDYPENRENIPETENGNDLELRYLRKLEEVLSLQIDIGYSTTDQCIYRLKDELNRHDYCLAAKQYIESSVDNFAENDGERRVDAYLERMENGGVAIEPEDNPEFPRLQQLWGELEELERELSAREYAIPDIADNTTDNQTDAHIQQMENNVEIKPENDPDYCRLQRLWEELQEVKKELEDWEDAKLEADFESVFGPTLEHKHNIFATPFWKKALRNHPIVKLLKDADNLEFMQNAFGTTVRECSKLSNKVKDLETWSETLRQSLQTVYDYYSRHYGATLSIPDIIMSHYALAPQLPPSPDSQQS